MSNQYAGQAGYEAYAQAWDEGYKYGQENPNGAASPPSFAPWNPDAQALQYMQQLWLQGREEGYYAAAQPAAPAPAAAQPAATPAPAAAAPAAAQPTAAPTTPQFPIPQSTEQKDAYLRGLIDAVFQRNEDAPKRVGFAEAMYYSGGYYFGNQYRDELYPYMTDAFLEAMGEKDMFEGPAFDVYKEGIPYAEVEQEQRELLEHILHKHMPHTHAETEVEVQPGPGVPSSQQFLKNMK